MQRLRVWDLPTRLFHWLLAAAIAAAGITGEIGGGVIEIHGKIGLCIVGLIAFRLAWGVVGSTTARFSSFVRGPAAIRAYLQGTWRGIGHNPLGALSVLGLLALIAAQVGTGLFANDDIAFQGPLSVLIDKELSDALGELHEEVFGLLLTLIGLHLAAIVFYVRVKKHSLVNPMLTGWQDDAPNEAQAPKPAGPLALVIALAFAALAVWGASAAWYTPPPAPPASNTAAPAW
jgi:cytochrome b